MLLFFRFIIFTFLMTVMYCTAFGVVPAAENSIANKASVMDGHVVHNLGQLSSNVTNWGLIGSMPSLSTPYSDSPSAMWPAGSGNEYLFGAGLWVGGVVIGETLVSTGFPNLEIQATMAAGDTIFSASQDDLGGTRFPWPGADDDGDGRDDEDPLDGVDNDNDGWTDEDFAAIGDQGYYCTLADNSPQVFEHNPVHTALNVKVTQQSYQWNDPLTENFIGYQYTIENIGVEEIHQFCCGLYSDFDIGIRGDINGSDDFASSYQGIFRASDDSFVPISMAYMKDSLGPSGLPGWAAWVMCGLETDALGGLNHDPMTLPTVQIFSASAPFDEGGDPSNDAERYEALTAGEWDPSTPPSEPNDYRVLIGAQILSTLRPGESVTFRVALVLGAGLGELRTNAAEAVLTAQGKNYDRDGDPNNGAEFNVPWMRPNDGPPLAVPEVNQSAVLYEAIPNPFNPQTTIAFELSRSTTVSLRVFDMSGRLVAVLLDNEIAVEGRTEVIWGGIDLTGRSASTGVYFYRLEADSYSETKRMTLLK